MQSDDSFKPAWWLPGPHLQTIWPTLHSKKINLSLRRERFELPDGDFLDIDWVGPEQGPIVVLLHGIAGNLDSPYIKRSLNAFIEKVWRGALLYFRGCSGTTNRLPRYYHSGETTDMHYVLNQLREREPGTPIACVGFSLGGNVLLKWLGENQRQGLLKAAVAISVPFELHKAANRLNSGFSRIYQWMLLREMRNMIKQKCARMPMPISNEIVDELRTFWQYDNYITAPLHGFKNANEYYKKASSRQYIPFIQTPTLILHAYDDPFLPPDAIPSDEELPSCVKLILVKQGGHVGFVSGEHPWQTKYWFEEQISAYLQNFLDH